MAGLQELRARAEACAAGEREQLSPEEAAAASGPCRVRARREHGRRLVFLDLEEGAGGSGAEAAEEAEAAEATEAAPGPAPAPVRIQAVLDARDAPAGERPGRWAALSQLCSAGSVVAAEGVPGRSKRGEPSLYVRSLRLVQVQPDPSCVLRLLRAVSEGDIGPSEAAAALQCEDVDTLLHLAEEHPEAARAQAVLITRRLSGKAVGWTRERRQKVRREDRELLEAYAERAAQWPVRAVGPGVRLELGPVDPSLNLPNRDDPRRRRYVEERKRPQIEWLVAQVREMAQERGAKFQSILDVGGGRGDLALALAHCFPETQVRVLDANPDSLRAGEARAAEAGVKNIAFAVEDVESEKASAWAAESDLLVGLHACGGLSDALLRLALGAHASFLICTCCFAGNGHLCRAGQWPFKPAGDKVALCRLAESMEREVAAPAQHIVNAGRLQAAIGKAPGLKAGVLTFPLKFSPRNMVLRGYFSRGPRESAAAADGSSPLPGEKRPRG